MKKLFLFATLLVIGIANAQVKIGNNPTSMNPASILELESTTQGFLMPRLTYAQRTDIANPPAGLQVWCTDCGDSGELQLFTGTSWVTSSVLAGNIPPIICAQSWATLNLDVTTYSDGTLIPEVTDNTTWAGLTTGAWCYYNNDAANNTTYGKLYNWYAAVGIYDAASLANPDLRKKLAPLGYHVPTDAEWTTLTSCLGGESVAGSKMKETGTSHWLVPNTDATNSSGFTGLPGGGRYNGTFNNIAKYGSWWGSSEIVDYVFGGTSVFYRGLIYNNVNVYRGEDSMRSGYSVRCLRD